MHGFARAVKWPVVWARCWCTNVEDGIEGDGTGEKNHGETQNLYDELRKHLPSSCCEAERKGRTKAEVDQVFAWLPGYGRNEMDAQLEKRTDLKTVFAEAPKIDPSRRLIRGVVCGVRVEGYRRADYAGNPLLG